MLSFATRELSIRRDAERRGVPNCEECESTECESTSTERKTARRWSGVGAVRLHRVKWRSLGVVQQVLGLIEPVFAERAPYSTISVGEFVTCVALDHWKTSSNFGVIVSLVRVDDYAARVREICARRRGGRLASMMT